MEYGALCFRRDGISLSGDLKLKSADFEVREIDLSGNVAGVVKLTIDSNGTGNSNCAGQTLNDTEDLITALDIPPTNDHDQPWMIDPKLYLKDVVGEETLGLILNLSCGSNDSNEVNIGVFNDKMVRAKVHECVRYIFPDIVIEVKRTDDDGRQMVCKIDNLWSKIKTIFNENVKSCKKIMQFIYCRNLWAQFSNGVTNLEICVTDFNKDERRKIHNTIGELFGKIIETKTIKKDEDYFISLRFKEKRQSLKRKRASNSHHNVLVVLKKDNQELLTVLGKLSFELNTRLSNIKYAGIKDKAAVTYQFLSLTGVDLKKVKEISATQFSGWSIIDPVSSDTLIQTGQLKGNLFKIIVRNVSVASGVNKSAQEILKMAAVSVQTLGFINYFGQQRFGEDMMSPRIGLCLLKNEYMKAVKLLLRPNDKVLDSDSCCEKSKRCFAAGKENYIKEALSLMPQHKTRERLILQGLNRYSFTEDGCCKSFMNLPHTVRLFYVHSYCSLIWNKAVSERINTHGWQVLRGDLVKNEDDSLKFVSESDVLNGCYGITDIIFPLPGTSTKMPDNATMDIYKDLLTKDSINTDNFHMRKLGLKVPGAHRSMVAKPINFNAEILSTSLESDTDVDVLLQFELPSSTYATMLVRELLHKE